MEGLTPRQETLLGLSIREYVESATPISSGALVEKYNLGVSSATLRNDMAALTRAGYLRQPHTSAGRVPTEQGYRYFVQRLVGEADLPLDERNTISHQFYQMRGEVGQWMQLAASVLARHSRAASLVTSPHPERSRFKHLELIGTHGRQVLLVLVMAGGEVRQQMLTLAEPVSQPALTEAASHINEMALGLPAKDIEQRALQMSTLENEVSRLICDIMHRADAVAAGDLYRDGLTNVLAQPEFADGAAARQALRVLEERSFLEEVLAKALSPNVGGVQVVIGGEGDWEELKNCSIVLSRYGASGYATGVLGVLGPTRMAYGRTISAVRYVAGLMSELVVETFVE